MSSDKLSHTLPTEYLLNSQYRIESVLGEGGFGITYKAADVTLVDTYVAIKEYYPSGIAARKMQGDNPYYVTHFDGKLAVSFRKGLDRFRQEAYLLKEFSSLESIVSVIDIFDSNNTTYIVMEYIEGLTIQKLVRKDGPMSFPELIDLMKPLLKDMSIIHQKGLIHRDISPDNLLIGMDNRLHLIDFGSANHSNLNSSKTYTVILKAGYAPPEQYIPNGKIGSWTDVYGICATIFYALTGHVPVDSLQRMQHDPANKEIYEKLSNIEALTDYQLDAIICGLSLSAKDRFPSVSLLLNALTTPPGDDRITEIKPHTSVAPSFRKRKIILPVFICTILILAIMIPAIILKDSLQNGSSTKGSTLSAVTTESNTMSVDTTEGNTISHAATDNSGETTFENNILTMVNFTGWTINDAAKYLGAVNSGIQIYTNTEYSDTVEKGTVISQSIKENSSFTKGSINNITLTISNGKEPVKNNVTDSVNATNKSTYNKTSGSSKSNSTGGSSSNSSSSKKSKDGYTVIHIGD